MFEVEITRVFSAAHQLRGYDGDCRNLHGHNYSVTVTVRADQLNSVGIALDFKRLKSEVDRVLDAYDHHNLSELLDFAAVNPTSEILAATIYRKLAAVLNDGVMKLHRVKVGESANSAVTYFED